ARNTESEWGLLPCCTTSRCSKAIIPPPSDFRDLFRELAVRDPAAAFDVLTRAPVDSRLLRLDDILLILWTRVGVVPHAPSAACAWRRNPGSAASSCSGFNGAPRR